MAARATYGRRLGAVALGVGLGLLAFGIASSAVSDPAADDDTATEGTTTQDTDRSVSGTDDRGSAAPTVAGITVTREQRSPVDDADDYSLIIIGAGLAVAGGASLRLANRATMPAPAPPPYRPKHRR